MSVRRVLYSLRRLFSVKNAYWRMDVSIRETSTQHSTSAVTSLKPLFRLVTTSVRSSHLRWNTTLYLPSSSCAWLGVVRQV